MTTADPAWVPVLPIPNHPEYPSGHGCITGARMETLRIHYGTELMEFQIDSAVTGTTRTYTNVKEMLAEVRDARVYGGMHYRFSTVRGTDLGVQVARQVMQKGFNVHRPWSVAADRRSVLAL